MSEEKDLTVKAKANEEGQGCTCPCAQPLENYVLTVDFVNALQNIRNMINDAINNVDLSEIYKKLIKEIQAALEDVWKHVGLIQGPNNKIEEAKSILNGLPESQLRQGDTRILTYNKEIHNNDGTITTKQMNDLYVYLNQKLDPNSTEIESEKKKWMKIVTTEFTMDSGGGEDISLDDIIRRLEKLEDSIAEIIKIVTSIWAYLCKNWWEFVDTAETIAEIEEKTDATIAQNYYCKEDNNIYVYLKIDGTEDDPEMDWIPLLNANNLPYYQYAWRHTTVVDKSSWDPTTASPGKFFGETVYMKGSMNGQSEDTDRRHPALGTVYVWLPTMGIGTIGGKDSAKWVPLANENQLQQAWRHTSVVTSKPNEGTGSNGAGKFIGETRYCTTEENVTEKPKGDVFVWLPSVPGVPGTDLHWVNITRNKEINDIKNYVPEYVKYNFTKTDVINPFLRNSLDLGRATVGGTIERNGIMVNCNFTYNMYGGFTRHDDNSRPTNQTDIFHMHDYRTGGAGIYRNQADRYFGLTSPWTQIGLHKMQLLGKITSAQREEARSYVNLSNIRTVLDKNNRSHSINSNQAIQYFVPSIQQHFTVSMDSYSFVSTDTTEGKHYKFKWGGEEHSWTDTWARLMELVTWNRLKQIPQKLDFSDANVFWAFLQLLWDDSNNSDGSQGFDYTKNMPISADVKVDAKGGFISTSSFDILTSGLIREGSTKTEISDNYWMRKNYAVSMSVSWPGRAVTNPIVVN